MRLNWFRKKSKVEKLLKEILYSKLDRSGERQYSTIGLLHVKMACEEHN